jgi:hypothetical protein
LAPATTQPGRPRDGPVVAAHGDPAAVFVLVGAAVIVGYVLLGWLGAIVLFLVAGAGAVLGAWMFLRLLSSEDTRR